MCSVSRPCRTVSDAEVPATHNASQTTEAILSLGSNQGDRLTWLKQACTALDALQDVRLLERSPMYETEPVNVPPCFTHDFYLNQIVIVETTLTPLAFSKAAHLIEQHLGRTRDVIPNLPRTLDIDIITFGTLRTHTPELTLPHPRARERRFVLQPLADLRPDLVLPGETRSVADLLRTLPGVPRVTRLTP